jgi:hypothetical protein
MHRTGNSPLRRLLPAGDCCRVCQAWHRACGVQVPTPGIRGAEGEEKGKGVTARWGLKEAQSERAGRVRNLMDQRPQLSWGEELLQRQTEEEREGHGAGD